MMNERFGDLPSATTYRVGEWDAHPNACRLVRNGTDVKLSPRTMSVLGYLAERSGETVTHEELIAEFWHGRTSSANAVHKCVAELRHTFGRGAGEPVYIETVPKRGYRLVAPVERREVPRPAGLKSDAIEAQILSTGTRTAVLLPVHPCLHTGSEYRTLETIQSGVIARTIGSPSASARWLSLPASQTVNSNTAANLGVDYIVQINLEEVGDRLHAGLTIVPASPCELTHRVHFEVVSADRQQLIADVISHASEDLRVLLDEHSVQKMSDLGTKSVRAYRYAREGDMFERTEAAGSLAHAAEQFRYAIKEDPTFESGYLSLASVYRQMGWFPDGTATLETVRLNMQALLREASLRRLQPDVISRVQFLYDDLCTTNAFDAEALWRRQLLKDPTDVYALRMYSRLLVGAKLVTESEAYVARAASLAPANARDDIESEYATTREAAGDIEGAIRRMKENIENHPDFTVSLYGLVRALANTGRYIEAESYLMRLNSTDAAWARGARLALQAQRGDIPTGSVALEEALASPRRNNASRGIVSFMLGDVDAGIRYWRQVGFAFLRLRWQFISSDERYWAKGVVEDARYQALLDELGIGKTWRTYMRAKAAELTPITGIAVTSQIAAEDIDV